MKVIVALLGCFLTLSGHAQAPARALQSNSAIQVTVLQQGRYSHLPCIVNHGLLTSAIPRALMLCYPSVAAELRKGRVQQGWGLALLPVMVVAFLVSKQQTDQQAGPDSAFSRVSVPVSLFLGAFGSYG